MRQSGLPGDWKKLRPGEQPVIGIEIGGRGQRVVVADPRGRILGQAHSIDSSAPASVVMQNIEGLTDQALLAAGIEIDAIATVGIAFGGPVDSQRGTTILSHRAPGYENFPLLNLVEDRFGRPAVIENDARAAALGESMFGAARGSSDLVYVHLGTGVGAGIISGGRLLTGASNTAGEIGHMVVSIGGPICSCGKPGHLEAYASWPSILNRLRERLQSAPETEVARWSDPRSLNAKSVFERARTDAGVARDVATETIQVLGLALANLITVLNPSVVVIGGSVSDAGEALADPLGSRLRQYAFAAAARHVRVSTSELGPDANVIGAVALALGSQRR
jgi:glucokinase